MQRLHRNPELAGLLSTGIANRDVQQVTNRTITGFSFETAPAFHIHTNRCRFLLAHFRLLARKLSD
jgi:hypothetical protein